MESFLMWDKTYRVYIVNIMAADGLATQRASASASKILALLEIIRSSHFKG